VAKSSYSDYSDLRWVMVKLSSRYFGRRKGPSLLRLDRLPESPVPRNPTSSLFALFCCRGLFFPGFPAIARWGYASALRGRYRCSCRIAPRQIFEFLGIFGIAGP
jgi:hypothetical protein